VRGEPLSQPCCRISADKRWTNFTERFFKKLILVDPQGD
jgi:hypothetical protein